MTLYLPNRLVIIKGAGDLASGVAHRLCNSGFRVIMLENKKPTMLRRTVSFGQAVYQGKITIEGLTAVFTTRDNFSNILSDENIPVINDYCSEWLDSLDCLAFIEATMRKTNHGLSRKPGRQTIALGPGFIAGSTPEADVDAVIETIRGHYLGRLILNGSAQANTSCPEFVGGFSLERLIRSPTEGRLKFYPQIGQTVKEREIIGQVGTKDIVASITGVLRGAIHNGLYVYQNQKIGDIDPREKAADYIHTISDKARSVAGGVLEALLYFLSQSFSL
jgi:xanthine dehydrogenase accessory factor